MVCPGPCAVTVAEASPLAQGPGAVGAAAFRWAPGAVRWAAMGEDSSSDEELEAPRHQLARATGVQSRRSRWRAVPEYRDQIRIQAPAAVSEGLGRLKAQMRIGGVDLPAGAKVLARVGLENGGPGGADSVTLLVGIPWSPREFAEQTKVVGDPFDVLPAVKAEARRAVFNNLVKGPEAVAKHHESVLRFWADRRDQLAGREAKLHHSLDQGGRAGDRGKDPHPVA